MLCCFFEATLFESEDNKAVISIIAVMCEGTFLLSFDNNLTNKTEGQLVSICLLMFAASMCFHTSHVGVREQ